MVGVSFIEACVLLVRLRASSVTTISNRLSVTYRAATSPDRQDGQP
jgi:hypothetical protein